MRNDPAKHVHTQRQADCCQTTAAAAAAALHSCLSQTAPCVQIDGLPRTHSHSPDPFLPQSLLSNGLSPPFSILWRHRTSQPPGAAMARVAITAGLATLGSRPAATAAVSLTVFPGGKGRESGARGVARQNFRRDAWCRWLCDHGPTARTWKRSCAGLSKTCCPTPLVSLRPGGGALGAVYMVRCASHIGGVGARWWVWYVWMASGGVVDMVFFDVRLAVCNDQNRTPKDPPSGQLDRSLDNYRPFPVPQRHELVTPEPDAMPQAGLQTTPWPSLVGWGVRMELAKAN